jgi:hypothetical protein
MIAVAPRLLIVPPALEQIALQLLNSSALVGQENSAVFNSVRMQMEQPVVVPHFENSSFTNYSAAQWFLAAQKALNYARMGFLYGNVAPQTGSEIDFDTDGLKYKVKHYWSNQFTKPEYVQRHSGAGA